MIMHDLWKKYITINHSLVTTRLNSYPCNLTSVTLAITIMHPIEPEIQQQKRLYRFAKCYCSHLIESLSPWPVSLSWVENDLAHQRSTVFKMNKTNKTKSCVISKLSETINFTIRRCGWHWKVPFYLHTNTYLMFWPCQRSQSPLEWICNDCGTECNLSE